MLFIICMFCPIIVYIVKRAAWLQSLTRVGKSTDFSKVNSEFDEGDSHQSGNKGSS